MLEARQIKSGDEITLLNIAASMVDGRTVGEVTPTSASAKEIRDLWTYVQGRLARLKHDPTFAPEFVPQNFAISGLSPADASESVDAGDFVEPMDMPVPPPPPMPEPYTGVERHSGLDRTRVASEAPHGFANPPVQRPFGRL